MVQSLAMETLKKLVIESLEPPPSPKRPCTYDVHNLEKIRPLRFPKLITLSSDEEEETEVTAKEEQVTAKEEQVTMEEEQMTVTEDFPIR